MVTLLVSPAQAERLTLASTKGTLQLALRGDFDKNTPSTTGVTARQLIYGPARKAPGRRVASAPRKVARKPRTPRRALPAPKPSRPRPRSIEVFRGVKRTVEQVSE
ncbi:MAG: hypothetical protein ACE5IM_06770 [Nitrospinota bacterium]